MLTETVLKNSSRVVLVGPDIPGIRVGLFFPASIDFVLCVISINLLLILVDILDYSVVQVAPKQRLQQSQRVIWYVRE